MSKYVTCHTSFTFCNGEIVINKKPYMFEKNKKYLMIAENVSGYIFIKSGMEKTYGPGARFCVSDDGMYPLYTEYFDDILSSERHLKLSKLI